MVQFRGFVRFGRRAAILALDDVGQLRCGESMGVDDGVALAGRMVFAAFDGEGNPVGAEILDGTFY